MLKKKKLFSDVRLWTEFQTSVSSKSFCDRSLRPWSITLWMCLIVPGLNFLFSTWFLHKSIIMNYTMLYINLIITKCFRNHFCLTNHTFLISSIEILDKKLVTIFLYIPCELFKLFLACAAGFFAFRGCLTSKSMLNMNK